MGNLIFKLRTLRNENKRSDRKCMIMATLTSALESNTSKDDCYTPARIRHPTDRGRASNDWMPSGFRTLADSELAEMRARAHSSGGGGAGRRLNVYKRVSNSKDEPNNNGVTSTMNGSKCHQSPLIPQQSPQQVQQHHSSSSNGSIGQPETANGWSTVVNGRSSPSPTPPPLKRESWLQKSWRGSPRPAPPPVSPRMTPTVTSEELSTKKSPMVSNNPFSGLLEKLRPRSSSDASALMSTRDMVRRKNAMVSVECVFEGQQPPQQRSHRHQEQQYQFAEDALTTLEKHVEFSSSSIETLFEDEPSEMRKSPVRRKRSNSEATNFLIMRKTSRFSGTEVVTAVSRHDSYKQLLKKFTCYELMPGNAAIVAVDCQLPTRQALNSLADNGVRAGVVWDSRQNAPVSLVTVTDLLRIMFVYFSTSILEKGPDRKPRAVDRGQVSPTSVADVLRRPILSNLIKAGSIETSKTVNGSVLVSVDTRDTLHSAVALMRLHRLHRLAVIDEETGNPLYLLSSKRLLHFLYNHMSSLPLPSAMYRPLNELRLGVWWDDAEKSLCSVSVQNMLIEAVEKFLTSDASSLPIVEADEQPTAAGPARHRLVDVLTKVDLMHFVLENGWIDLECKTVADVLAVRHKTMERMVSCSSKTPLVLALDRLVQSNAHRIYVVDSSGALEGLLSIGDLLSYLVE